MTRKWPITAPSSFVLILLVSFLLGACDAPHCLAYSFLTHQQIIDLTWNDGIRPTLLARFPQATDRDIRNARAFAYGGATIQDMGYYPFGHEFFSDLTHYVRTGDFISSLLHNASNVNEYAFALGALSHYVGDNIGHHDAVNVATGAQFPKLDKQFGPVVTYDEAPHAHVRTEFAFDIDQLSHHRIAPTSYSHAIGLRVPAHLLQRSFLQTYGLTLRQVLGPEFPALRSYRSSIRSLLPHVANAEVLIHAKNFPPDIPDENFVKYASRVDETARSEGWKRLRDKPDFKTHLLDWLIRIVPKIGALSDLAIRGPNQAAEQDYVKSVDLSLTRYADLLTQLQIQHDGYLPLENRDLDTGLRVRPGEYRLTDLTYARLLRHLVSNPKRQLTEGLRRNIADYYADPNAPNTIKKDDGKWKQVQEDLRRLEAFNLPAQQQEPQ